MWMRMNWIVPLAVWVGTDVKDEEETKRRRVRKGDDPNPSSDENGPR